MSQRDGSASELLTPRPPMDAVFKVAGKLMDYRMILTCVLVACGFCGFAVPASTIPFPGSVVGFHVQKC